MLRHTHHQLFLFSLTIALWSLVVTGSHSAQAAQDEVSYQATVIEYSPKRPPLSRNPVPQHQAIALMNDNVDALLVRQDAVSLFRGLFDTFIEHAECPGKLSRSPHGPTTDGRLP